MTCLYIGEYFDHFTQKPNFCCFLFTMSIQSMRFVCVCAFGLFNWANIKVVNSDSPNSASINVKNSIWKYGKEKRINSTPLFAILVASLPIPVQRFGCLAMPFSPSCWKVCLAFAWAFPFQEEFANFVVGRIFQLLIRES